MGFFITSPYRVPFQKPALAVSDQVARLVTRGMVISDVAVASRALGMIGYYRFSGYCLPFQVGGSNANRHDFRRPTDFEDVVTVYEFDRRLRLLTLGGAERIEVALRANLSNVMCMSIGPHWYTDAACLDDRGGHPDLMAEISRQIAAPPMSAQKRSVAIKHYYEKYSSPSLPPSWMMIEAVSFGTVSKLFADIKRDYRKTIAEPFGVDEEVLTSWVRSLSYVRNVCAHHDRLWNRKFTVRGKIARRLERFLKAKGSSKENDTYYYQALCLVTLLRAFGEQAPFVSQLRNLLSAHNATLAELSGFRPDWLALEPWR